MKRHHMGPIQKHPDRRSCLILTANASVGVHSSHVEVVFVAWQKILPDLDCNASVGVHGPHGEVVFVAFMKPG